ncbi:hypothetical protein A0O34_10105 [Chryseobacterium glaciei]|uniref:TonB C-terminal domain-containing protein n=1 Tax=Chryseobacterium glaciei TaxID=1685010 RepID=A0A172XV49_9FLAO|nr:hypothetical protein [Chryseobacterium glaciei]ANF50848.1 hypothetical protein A0O34_10105 [Chryseobacterium glaciei]
MKNFLFILFLFPLLTSCQTEKAVVSKYSAHVGDITFDEKIDDPKFKRCLSEDFGIQYYNDSQGFQYKGEKISIEEKLKSLNIEGDKKLKGYITVRFLVNCDGKSGLFRVQQMNQEYKETDADKELTDQLLIFTKNLNGWIPKKLDGKKVDYYQYLTYKIENGKVSEILP